MTFRTLRLDILGVPFGTPTNTDRTKQWFTPETMLGEFHLAVLHDHDNSNLIGHVADHEVTPVGVRYLAVCLLEPRYHFIIQEAENDRLFASSGTGPNRAAINESGEIITWPIAEISLVTPYAQDEANRSLPANWRATARIVTDEWMGRSIS